MKLSTDLNIILLIYSRILVMFGLTNHMGFEWAKEQKYYQNRNIFGVHFKR
jgi:hypothetical protein